jgi:hypothetical protein
VKTSKTAVPLIRARGNTAVKIAAYSIGSNGMRMKLALPVRDPDIPVLKEARAEYARLP